MAEAMVIGALIFALGAAFGRLVPGRRRRPKPIQPICGCEHHHSYHDPKTGQCHGMMYVGSTESRASRYVPCTCRQYSGPTPLPEFIAPELSTDA